MNIGVTIVPSHCNHSIDGLAVADNRVTLIKCGETDGLELLNYLRKILQSKSCKLNIIFVLRYVSQFPIVKSDGFQLCLE
jgi:hypothetical protein